MKIIIGADPWGVKLKTAIVEHIEKRGIEVEDIGSHENAKRDYYAIAAEVAKAVQSKKADKGIVLCGTGMGVAIVANKLKGVNAALVEAAFAAYKAKQINNANVLAMCGMVVSEFVALDAVDKWLDT